MNQNSREIQQRQPDHPGTESSSEQAVTSYPSLCTPISGTHCSAGHRQRWCPCLLTELHTHGRSIWALGPHTLLSTFKVRNPALSRGVKTLTGMRGLLRWEQRKRGKVSFPGALGNGTDPSQQASCPGPKPCLLSGVVAMWTPAGMTDC